MGYSRRRTRGKFATNQSRNGIIDGVAKIRLTALQWFFRTAKYNIYAFAPEKSPMADLFSLGKRRCCSSRDCRLPLKFRKDNAMAKLDLIHPGEILLEEFMQPLGVSQNRLARDLNVPVNRINDLVHGRRGITADTALRLAKFFGTTPDFWLGLQMEYDLRRAKRETWPQEKDKVRTIEAA